MNTSHNAVAMKNNSRRQRRYALLNLRRSMRSMTMLQRLAGIFIGLVLISVWVTVLASLASQRQDAIDSQVLQNANVAQVLQEQTVRVIAAVDQVLLRTAKSASSGPIAQSEYQRFVDSTGLSDEILVQLSVIDREGRFVGSNIDPTGKKTGNVNLSDREHVMMHLTPDRALISARDVMTRDGLFIGRPVLGKVSGKWTIQLSRAVISQDGQIAGVVVASLNPGYFEEVYRAVSLGHYGGVTLIGADAIVRARVIGGDSAGMGTDLGNSVRQRKSSSSPKKGSWIGETAVDKTERVVSYHRAGSYPLFVYTMTAVDETLESWHATRNVIVSLALLLSLAVVGAGIGFMVAVRRLETQHSALQKSESQARAANQTKTEFLAAVSHELRTPLTSIRGFAELMEHRGEDARFREQASIIRKASEHLNELLSEILDLAKVEAGSMLFNNEDHSLPNLIRDTVELFQGSADKKHLALIVDLHSAVPNIICGDIQRLKQILNNLLSNAIKFTARGYVELRVEFTHDTWTFHVTDTGPGVAPKLHDTIFEKFRQADARVSYEHGGTGLGLALSRSLAQQMGGNVTLKSRVGTGSTFTFTMPLQVCGITAAQSERLSIA